MKANESKIETKDILQSIEDKRAAFVPFYKKHEKLEKVFFAVGLVVIFFGWIFLPMIWQENVPARGVVQACLMLVPAAGLVAYALIGKKIVNQRAEDFFKTFYKKTSEYVFDQAGCENLIPQEPSTLPQEKFDECLLFSNVTKLNSKGYSTFEYKKNLIEIADVAAITRKEKGIGVAFTGKYLVSKAKYEGKDRVIVYMKGKGIVLPPTNLEGLKSVVDNEQMTVWANSKDWKKIITPKALKIIESVKTNKILIDWSATIHDGKQYVCMGYDDPLMLPPFENEFDRKPTEQYKKEVAVILSLMEELA